MRTKQPLPPPAEWNETSCYFPEDQCIHQLFEKQVDRCPDDIAVSFGDLHLTYSQLNEQSSRLATCLKSLGVGPETLVGIYVERSIEMLVGILAILKSGGAYVPLDPYAPPQRLAFMLEDTAVPVLLTQKKLLTRLPAHGARVICLDGDWPVTGQGKVAADRKVTADNLAYIIYTSGSTGRPKAVMIEHRGLCNHMYWVQQARPLKTTDRMVLKYSLAFDAAAVEIFSPLLAGARLVLSPPAKHFDVASLLRLIRDENITILNLVPSLLQAMLDHPDVEACRSLRQVTCGGEILPSPLQKRFFARFNAELYNAYGPTETSITAACWKCRRDDLRNFVPIGRPIANTELYILDSSLAPMPVGTAGELYIGGVGLARGYLNRPALTGANFIASPFSRKAGSKLYKTGDLARYLADGSIEYLGRLDHQVKVRGYRIELGEIEARLLEHAGIREAIVVGHNNGETRLAAYYAVAENGDPPGINEIRSFLLEQLPDYMVPWVYMALPQLPRLASGKVDLGALPGPEYDTVPNVGPIPAPSLTEELVISIWQDALGVGHLAPSDNFFELGGHSLLAAQACSRGREIFGVELAVAMIFQHPTAADFAGFIDRLCRDETREPVTMIPASDRTGTLPLSFAQERVWFLEQLKPGNIAYNTTATVGLHGRLDTMALEKSLNEVVRRHEILRTSFPSKEGRPYQRIHHSYRVELPVIDLSGTPAELRSAELDRQILAAGRQPFIVSELPLVRWRLLRLSGREHLLLQVEHHFVHDGWSLARLLGEIKSLYAAFAAGRPSPLSELALQFADFAAWQRQWLQGREAAAQLAYWRRQLTGMPPVLEMPTDFSRPACQDFKGARVQVQLPPFLTEKLRALSRQHGATLFMTMVAAFQCLLQRYCCQDDIFCGTGIANRRLRQTEEMLGMVLNNVVLRTDLSGDPSFIELLGRVRKTALAAYANQDMPFEKIVEAVQPERSLAHNPLFQVMFNFHDALMPTIDLPGLQGVIDYPHNCTAKFDLNIIVEPHAERRLGMAPHEDGERLIMSWEYSTALFTEATVKQMTAHYLTLLEAIAASPQVVLSGLALVDAAEQQRLTEDCNRTASSYPCQSTIQEIFRRQVYAAPRQIALAFDNLEMSYEKLNGRANQLASFLIRLGVGPEIPVGLCLQRGIDLVVSILAILKAGGAYVPLDPDYPQQRLDFMLADTKAPVLLTLSTFCQKFSGYDGKIVCLDRDWPAISGEPDSDPVDRATAANLAYIIYTSGSTGQPKGTCIEHRAVLRLVKNTNYVDLSHREVMLQLAPISFDASTFELWASLLNGAKLVIYPPEKPTPHKLAQFLRRHNISVLWLTAALFNLMVDEEIDSLCRVGQIIAGGETLSVAHVKRALARLGNGRLINGYGPTENTTFTLCQPLTAASSIGRTVPIGRPIANTRVYILDPHLQPVPVGIPGELYIGGDGLARAYLNQPELTARSFIANPFAAQPGDRLYKSGDRVRFLDDGRIEYLGRLDEQLKLRGFRIEPGEIEAALREHDEVRETVVICRQEAGDKRLIAFLVMADGASLQTEAMQRHVAERLPGYMVPQAFVVLDRLPLTPNGKVDRNRLPVVSLSRPDLNAELVLPRTPTEQKIALIWQPLLQLEAIGVHHDFFALGGHSLLAAQVVNQMRRKLNLEIPLSRLFELPTIAGLAGYIDALLWARRQTGSGSGAHELEEGEI